MNIKVKLLEYVLTERRQKEASEKLINDIDALLKKQTIACRIKAKYQLMRSTYHQWMLFDTDNALIEAYKAQKTLKTCPDSDEEEAVLYFKLAQINARYGNIDKVVEYTDLFDQKIASVQDIPEIYKTVIYQAKAAALADKGDFDNAVLILNKAIDISNKNTDFSCNVIGLLIYKSKFLAIAGDNELALSTVSDLVSSIDKNFKGEDNIFSPSVPIIKAYIAYNQTKYNVALNYVNESLVFIKSDQVKDRSIAFLYAIAAKTHAKLNNVEQAILYYGKAEKMYFETLKYHKIHEISLLYFDMGMFYFGIHDYIRATDCLEKHESIFGKEHPNSI
ncbi:tetratricopeptide repeat protein, partial [Cysteiniphilum litorale]|uniref:tetratricopeptide repeat protein n=1 Tax=Cysteiniphilum litorale TaxID=2056700 RepID=UPI0013009DDC